MQASPAGQQFSISTRCASFSEGLNKEEQRPPLRSMVPKPIGVKEDALVMDLSTFIVAVFDLVDDFLKIEAP